MSGFILQVYKTINDYLNNCYLSFKYNKKLKIFPLIVTLEDWYLFGDMIFNNLGKLVEQKIKEADLPLTFLESMPYSVCSIENFEYLMQIIQIHGIFNVMKDKVYDKEMKQWSVVSYLRSRFESEMNGLEYLFEDDYNTLFDKFKHSVI